MSGVAAGVLRHKGELQENQITVDPVTGEEISSWVTVARPWAQIVPMSAREFFASAAEQSEARGRIVIRYRGNVTAAMRFVYRGKFYNIFGVMEDAESGRDHLTLMVGEGVRLDQ